MLLELKPTTKLTHKLRLSPQMRLSINLLQLPLIKLQEFIKQHVEENPLLDGEPVEPFERQNYNFDDQGKKDYQESLVTKPATLQEHLLKQLRILSDSKGTQKIGELIIGNIDDDGYLRNSVKEIAESAKTPVGEVEKVLFLIQTFNPIGVGARDIRECLLIQLRAKGHLSPEALAKGEAGSSTYQVIDKFLPYLEKKRFNYIAKKLKVSIKKVKEAVKKIISLEPKPGRSFNTERTILLKPDAILKKTKEGYEVISNNWELPPITLNNRYKQMIKQKDTPQETKEYLKERLKAAQTLIIAVERRKQTIQDVIKAIVYVQKDFLDKGKDHFKPMTLSQIANMVGKHKSTISSTVNNKYLQTPYGIFELRHFLSSGIKQKDGKILSSKAIKSKVKNLIDNENRDMPLSDQKIAKHLKIKGISISRRTIAKYRTRLKILPSQSRRE